MVRCVHDDVLLEALIESDDEVGLILKVTMAPLGSGLDIGQTALYSLDFLPQ